MELILEKETSGIFLKNNNLYFHNSNEFFMYDFINRTSIDKDDYFFLRYGTAYTQILEHFGINASLDLLWAELNDGSFITHYYQSPYFFKFDKQGNIVWKTESIGNFDTVYGIAIEGNSIWCAFPTNHTIKRYSLNTFKKEVSIGDKEPWSFKAEIFDHPEDVFILGNDMFVSDMGNRRICKIDLTTYNIQNYRNFDEPVWGYIQMNNQEFVWLSSGFYRL